MITALHLDVRGFEVKSNGNMTKEIKGKIVDASFSEGCVIIKDSESNNQFRELEDLDRHLQVIS